MQRSMNVQNSRLRTIRNKEIANKRIPWNTEITYKLIRPPTLQASCCQGPAILLRHCRQWLLYFDMNPSGGGLRLSGRSLLYIKGQIYQCSMPVEPSLFLFCGKEKERFYVAIVGNECFVFSAFTLTSANPCNFLGRGLKRRER